jgi:hypothetical protein
MTASIKRTGPNTFEVSSPDKLLTVLVSFETPVAVKNAEGRVFRTQTRWSRSTEAHIRDFQRAANWLTGGDWLQDNIDQALVELTGDSRLRGKAAAAKLGRTVDTEGGIALYDAHTEAGDANLVVAVNRRRRASR